jgi:hypothetical protein
VREVRGQAVIVYLLVTTFFVVMLSGPAGVDYVKQRREMTRHRVER